MNTSSRSNLQAIDVLNADKLHQACIINHLGEEVPITRAMIDASCEQLEKTSSKTATES
mgnify:CR=1 FL=1